MVTLSAGCQIDERMTLVAGSGGVGGADGDGTPGAGTGGGGDNGSGGAAPIDNDGGSDSGSGGETASGVDAAPTSGTGGVAITTGGGGTGGGTGGASPVSVCDGVGTRILTAAKVDDFEGGVLNPGWSWFSDVPGAENRAGMIMVTGGAAGTAHAAHYLGKGAIPPAMGGYGVGAVFNMAIDKARGIFCVDVTAFDGVTFWARANQSASGSNTNKINVNFVLPETNAVSVGGDCPDASMKWYNHPRKTITLTREWAQYAVRFSEAAGGSAVVNGRIQSLAFLSPDPDWDYSLDEIALF